LNEGCPEKIDWEFIGWVWNFRKKQRPEILEKLNKYSDKKVITIAEPNQAKALLARLQADRAAALDSFSS